MDAAAMEDQLPPRCQENPSFKRNAHFRETCNPYSSGRVNLAFLCPNGAEKAMVKTA